MSAVIFFVLYVALCILYLGWMKASPERPNRILFKILPLGMLLGATTEYMKQRHTLSIKNSSFAPRIYTMVGGLLFHAMSSIYYEFPSLGRYGMICYGTALLIEIYGYSSCIESFTDFTHTEIVIIAVYAVIFSIFYFYLLPKMTASNAIMVFVFSALDMSLAFVLTVHALRYPYSYHYIGMAGGCLRYTSGIVQVLALWRIHVPRSFEVILTIYYTAQLAITASVLLPITL